MNNALSPIHEILKDGLVYSALHIVAIDLLQTSFLGIPGGGANTDAVCRGGTACPQPLISSPLIQDGE